MLPLFDQIEDSAIRVRHVGDRFFYECPHCGGEVSQGEDDEPIERLRADPACCFCRAEFAGIPFGLWVRFPMETKATHRPPGDWRSTRLSQGSLPSAASSQQRAKVIA